MKKGNKKGILKTVILCVVAILLVLIIGIWVAFEFYFLPKLNAGVINDEEKITSGDVFDIAKYLTDEQMIENIKNFDKQTAKEMVALIDEIEKEMGGQKPTNTPKPATKPKEDSAYERIMASASKEEIARGMEVIKKINMKEANAHYEKGGEKALKRYIVSTLSKKDLNTVVELYRKYSHLL